MANAATVSSFTTNLFATGFIGWTLCVMQIELSQNEQRSQELQNDADMPSASAKSRAGLAGLEHLEQDR
ncbi:hypothetical protein H0H92_000925 [Tricholoma furcatifolium]|nr:hypothetical protein H0H92_000925 [Tricholoma furcatifolium]